MLEYPHSITIQTYVEAQDANTGEISQTWSTYKTADALVVPVSGQEYYEAQKLTNPINYEVYMDYDSGITPKHRVIFEGVTLNIQTILPTMLEQNGLWEKVNLKCSSA